MPPNPGGMGLDMSTEGALLVPLDESASEEPAGAEEPQGSRFCTELLCRLKPGGGP